MFPQLLQYLQNPNNIITVQPSTEYEGIVIIIINPYILDCVVCMCRYIVIQFASISCLYSLGYIARVTALNNLLVLAQQLLTNIQTSVSHKYIAHQLALLYVSHYL